jgi:hypothetical protein
VDGLEAVRVAEPTATKPPVPLAAKLVVFVSARLLTMTFPAVVTDAAAIVASAVGSLVIVDSLMLTPMKPPPEPLA